MQGCKKCGEYWHPRWSKEKRRWARSPCFKRIQQLTIRQPLSALLLISQGFDDAR